MAAYAVVEVNITDPSRYDEYKRLAAQTVADYGGRYIFGAEPRRRWRARGPRNGL